MASDDQTNPAPSDTLSAPAVQLVIVRRGRFATFERLARAFAGDEHVRVLWDRRGVDRGRAVSVVEERRRSASPWPHDDFILIRDGRAVCRG